MVRCLHIGDTAARLPSLTSPPPSVIRKYGCATYVAEHRPRLPKAPLRRPLESDRCRFIVTRDGIVRVTDGKKEIHQKATTEAPRNELRRLERSSSGMQQAKFDERTDLCRLQLCSLTRDSIVPRIEAREDKFPS